MKVQFIDQQRSHHGVRRLCRMLQISPSAYYAARNRPASRRTQRQAEWTERIREAHVASRDTYGSPRIHAELKAQGDAPCENTVARLMRHAGIVPRMVPRFRVTTDSRGTRPAPNLLDRVFTADHANQCWLTDMTFIPTGGGWLYLAVILDLYSRSVVGWAMGERIDRFLAIDALTMAIERRGAAPAVLHSDQGNVYGAAEYRALMAQHGITQSMSRKGDCWDNAPMESFFHTLKTELVMHCRYQTRDSARASLFEFMEVFYNRQRRHSSLNYLSPFNFESQQQTPL
jgi:transposase InsO family protein